LVVERINQMTSQAENPNAVDEVELIGLRWIFVAALFNIVVGVAFTVSLDQASPNIVVGILVLMLLDHGKRRPLYIRKDADPVERARTIGELISYAVAAAVVAAFMAWIIDYVWES
jgi:hypothetical protein